MNSQVFGPGHVLLATTLFAASSVLARVAYDDGGNPLAFVTVRAAAAVAILWVWLALSAEPWKLSIRDRNHAVMLGLVVTVNHFALNVAIERIPVALAVLMSFLYPLFVTIIDVARKREPFSMRSAIAAVITLIGIAMVIPEQPTAVEVSGLLWGLLSAISWTVVLLLTAKWFPSGDSRPRTLFLFVTVFVVSLILALATRSATWPDSVGGAAAVMGGSLAFALGLMGLFITMAALGPGRTAFYLNFEPLAVLVLALFVLGQPLSKTQLLGAVLVIIALFMFRLPATKFALGRRR
jgi:drug/metabolite transporter (DMT)-like permease